ncbi:hypothetical protein [uncultured Selenomonas sp.]|uniref:hypothetical protein n=1 Tax=uncultured Selenomonas sp. TaxID=159275 RepID=UPI0028DB9D9F|nr:hypothetical protein [uncultured Selenomonas sp.]
MEECQQYTITREVRFDGGQTIAVTVRLCGQEKKDYGKIIPIAKVLFEEIKSNLENQS